jgi:TrmH family RNA methyltransferase
VKRITSRENSEFRRLRQLARSSRERRSSGHLLLDGEHLIEAYGAAFGYHRMQVVLSVSRAGDYTRWSARTQVDPVVLSDALFDQVSPVETPTGVLAVAQTPQSPGRLPDTQSFAVLVDGVQDPGNLGAILRSAAAAGAGRVLLSADCAEPWSPKCLRGGMGAQFLLDIADRADLPAAARAFPGQLVAAHSRGDQSLFQADLRGTIGFVLGGEGKGVSSELLALSQVHLRIPMRPGVESLNVAAAASVLFYEWFRQRGTNARETP